MLNNIKKHLFPKTIKMQFLVSAVAVSIIPITIVIFFSYNQYSQVMKNKVLQTTSVMLSVIDWNISQIINEVEGAANIVIGSEVISSSLVRSPDKVLPGERIQMQNNVQKLLINMVNNKPYIDKIFVGNRYVSFVQRSTMVLNDQPFTYEQLIESPLYEKLKEAKGKGLWIKPDTANGKNGDLLYYFRILKDMNTLEDIGIMAISINKSVFDQMLEKTTGNSSGDIIVLGEEQLLYQKSFSNDKLPENELSKTLQSGGGTSGTIVEAGGRQYIISSINSSHTGWKIVSMTSYDDFMKESGKIRNTTLNLMLISFTIAALAAIIAANGITFKLKKLMKAMHSWEKSKGFEEITFDSESEIGRVGNEFMRIAIENETLNTRLYQSMVKEKEAELMVLQSQVNPHFLYNTLNSIFWMAQNIKAANISQMVLALSRFFKISLNNGEKITSISNEVELVKNYMYIQNARYKNRFDVDIDIPDSILGMKIIKLLIQPLVENAIYHGLEMKEGYGRITIRAQETDDSLVIIVADDGVGFDMTTFDYKRGYALKNIDERIKLYYGENYGMSIESTAGKGTCVTLKVGRERCTEGETEHSPE